MSNLTHRQQKIQEKRKQTSWREFLMEIGSWKPFTFYNIDGVISVYASTERIKKVIDPDAFADTRDMLPSIDFTRDFTKGFSTLWNDMTLPGRLHFGLLENAQYTTTSTRAKNNYLTYNISNVEDVAYTVSVKAKSRNVINSVMVYDHCDTVYMSYAVFNGFNIFYSRYIHNSSYMRFCSNCINCQECLFCRNLENKSYCINNKQLTKEEYLQQKNVLLQQKQKYSNWWSQIDREGLNIASENADGSCLIKSTDVSQSHSIYNISHGRNVYMSGEEIDNQYIYDALFVGALGGSHYYGVVDIAGCEHLYCSMLILGSSFIYYSYYLQNCSYCFGCIGLQNKSFCIYNKKYTKEERHEKVHEIFTQMEQDSLLGKFFPGSMCPFYFNDTAAYLLDSTFTKEEVEAKGYLWRDEIVQVDIPETVELVKTNELHKYEGGGNDTWSIDPSILQKVIQDEQGNIYRIVKMEYDFLMKHGLPLPRNHWLERLKQHMQVV